MKLKNLKGILMTFLSAGLMLGFTACGSDDNGPDDNGEDDERIFLVSTEELTFGPEAGQQTVTITVKNATFSIAIPDEAKSWLSVSTTTGNSTTEVAFKVKANEGSQRFAEVQVAGAPGFTTKKINVKQTRKQAAAGEAEYPRACDITYYGDAYGTGESCNLELAFYLSGISDDGKNISFPVELLVLDLNIPKVSGATSGNEGLSNVLNTAMQTEYTIGDWRSLPAGTVNPTGQTEDGTIVGSFMMEFASEQSAKVTATVVSAHVVLGINANSELVINAEIGYGDGTSGVYEFVGDNVNQFLGYEDASSDSGDSEAAGFTTLEGDYALPAFTQSQGLYLANKNNPAVNTVQIIMVTGQTLPAEEVVLCVYKDVKATDFAGTYNFAAINAVEDIKDGVGQAGILESQNVYPSYWGHVNDKQQLDELATFAPGSKITLTNEGGTYKVDINAVDVEGHKITGSCSGVAINLYQGNSVAMTSSYAVSPLALKSLKGESDVRSVNTLSNRAMRTNLVR